MPSDRKFQPSSSPEVGQLPKLGNFSRILASAQISSQAQFSCSSGDSNSNDFIFGEPHPILTTEKYSRLGDFKKVFNEFQPPISSEHIPPAASLVQTDSIVERRATIIHTSEAKTSKPLIAQTQSNTAQSSRDAPKSSARPAINILKRPSISQYMEEDTSSSHTELSSSESDRILELDASVLTPASTPPSLEDKIKPSRTSASKTKILANPVIKSHRKPESGTGILISYHTGKGNSIFNIYEKLHTQEQKHKALVADIFSHRTLDILIAKKYPKVASNGAHVFIDMSNIDIGFQSALKARYKLADNTHFSPLPHLNLKFLTEALVRGRATVTRFVGCSVVPGRPAPRYIQELQKLGYRVDLRERKRIQDSKPTPANIRYVEDLVDETLQTRIAESVMEYFQEQGTIILATGDAKPAQYSDGFFTYAERALRMGWNIELVSWKSSLSSTWTSRKWKAQWGDRFRIIELDDFLDNLLACYL